MREDLPLAATIQGLREQLTDQLRVVGQIVPDGAEGQHAEEEYKAHVLSSAIGKLQEFVMLQKIINTK